MKRFKKLLVATDTRLNEHPIVDEAAEIALANAASLTIVDVVPASSWIASSLPMISHPCGSCTLRRRSGKSNLSRLRCETEGWTLRREF